MELFPFLFIIKWNIVGVTESQNENKVNSATMGVVSSGDGAW